MNSIQEIQEVLAFEQRKEETLKRELRKCQTVQRTLAKELQRMQQKKRNNNAMSELQ